MDLKPEGRCAKPKQLEVLAQPPSWQGSAEGHGRARPCACWLAGGGGHGRDPRGRGWSKIRGTIPCECGDRTRSAPRRVAAPAPGPDGYMAIGWPLGRRFLGTLLCRRGFQDLSALSVGM